MVSFSRLAIGLAVATRPAAAFTSKTNRCTRTICKSTTSQSEQGLWTEVAINASKQFTITQRKKLDESGLLKVARPIKIVGESVSTTCDIGDCVIDYDAADTDSSAPGKDTKIIHFQRHGQGYHNLICDMYREF
jgi:hypothetical protein